MWAACGDAQIEPLKLVIPTNCHGPQKRATQANVELISRADARLLGGPIKSGHDDTALAFARDDKILCSVNWCKPAYLTSPLRGGR